MLKVNGYQKIHHENPSQKEAEMAILVLDKIDFRTMNISRDRENSK